MRLIRKVETDLPPTFEHYPGYLRCVTAQFYTNRSHVYAVIECTYVARSFESTLTLGQTLAYWRRAALRESSQRAKVSVHIREPPEPNIAPSRKNDEKMVENPYLEGAFMLVWFSGAMVQHGLRYLARDHDKREPK